MLFIDRMLVHNASVRHTYGVLFYDHLIIIVISLGFAIGLNVIS